MGAVINVNVLVPQKITSRKKILRLSISHPHHRRHLLWCWLLWCRGWCWSGLRLCRGWSGWWSFTGFRFSSFLSFLWFRRFWGVAVCIDDSTGFSEDFRVGRAPSGVDLGRWLEIFKIRFWRKKLLDTFWDQKNPGGTGKRTDWSDAETGKNSRIPRAGAVLISGLIEIYPHSFIFHN